MNLLKIFRSNKECKQIRAFCYYQHIVDVAQAFNKFYNSRILKAEEDVMKARLNLVEASCICIKTG